MSQTLADIAARATAAADHAAEVADFLAARIVTLGARDLSPYAEGSAAAYSVAWMALTGREMHGPVLSAAAQRHADRVLTVAEFALPASDRMVLAAMREPRP